jgi:hypothetical protein
MRYGRAAEQACPASLAPGCPRGPCLLISAKIFVRHSVRAESLRIHIRDPSSARDPGPPGESGRAALQDGESRGEVLRAGGARPSRRPRATAARPLMFCSYSDHDKPAPSQACPGGVPDTCTVTCAVVFVPFYRQVISCVSPGVNLKFTGLTQNLGQL